MHKQIAHPPLLPSTEIQKLITGITGITYKIIRWNTKLFGSTISSLLELLPSIVNKIKESDKKEVILSILNGVIGDYLEEKNNPLQLGMEFRSQSKSVQLNAKSLKENFPNNSGKIILMIHGSCMSSLQWTRNNHNHGEILANDLNKTLLYLNYNSGRHISTNGKNLNKLLKTLSKNWPVPIKEIAIIAHSMGGLVTRSTLHYAKKQNQNWAKSLKKVVFLGTPHHGSPIEKIGNYLDLVLATVPYANPFAKLGKIRSAGVTDLRYGNIIDKDWKNKNRFELKSDDRQTIQLPKEIEFYAIAGVLSNKLNNLLGDSLVDLKSALGKHKNPDKDLNFLKENTLILFENNHLDLLSNPQITDKLKVWLS